MTIIRTELREFRIQWLLREAYQSKLHKLNWLNIMLALVELIIENSWKKEVNIKFNCLTQPFASCDLWLIFLLSNQGTLLRLICDVSDLL